MRLRLAFATLMAASQFGGCTNTDEIFVPSITATNFAASLGVSIPASTETVSGLFYRDISTGGGAAVPATSGTRVTIQYTGWLRNGVEFDAGTFSFTTGTVGPGSAILGMDEGVRGMNVGGVRQLIIPPDLAYGSDGTTGIPGQSILVFRVTLLSIG
jgi:FKBP-type peptidyl-prolyl cis-trans isomerase FkpA